jgi:iron complex transport system substrate-binding protein
LCSPFLSGCTGEKKDQQEGNNVSLTARGNKVSIEKTPEKVISLSPAITEMLFALNLEETIAGTTDYCDYPEAANHTPKWGI